MSNVPPPPPPPPQQPQFPPQQPQFPPQGAPSWSGSPSPTPGFPVPPPPNPQAVPSGYVPYGQAAPNVGTVRPSAGLGKATVVLFWLTAGSSVVLTFALFARRSTWDNFVTGDASFEDLDNSDGFVGSALLLQWALILTSAILVCLWSKRIVDNAEARGVPDLSPGMAAGGWFIPIGFYWLGFQQLRKADRGLGSAGNTVTHWQIAFVAMSVVTGIVFRAGDDLNTLRDPDDVSSSLMAQGTAGAISAVAYIAAAFFAMRAVKDLNHTVTGT